MFVIKVFSEVYWAVLVSKYSTVFLSPADEEEHLLIMDMTIGYIIIFTYMYSRRIAYRLYYSDLYIKVKFAAETLI